MLSMVPTLNKTNFYEWKNMIDLVVYQDQSCQWEEHRDGDFLMKDEQEIKTVKENNEYLNAGRSPEAKQKSRKFEWHCLLTCLHDVG